MHHSINLSLMLDREDRTGFMQVGSCYLGGSSECQAWSYPTNKLKLFRVRIRVRTVKGQFQQKSNVVTAGTSS